MKSTRYSRKHNPPADPRFVAAIREGFAQQAQEYTDVMAGFMRSETDSFEKDSIYGLTSPDTLPKAQRHLDMFKERLLEDLAKETTSQGQRDCLLQHLRITFYTHIYRRSSNDAPLLMWRALELGLAEYLSPNMAKTQKRDTPPKQDPVPINRSNTLFWEDAQHDMHRYASLILDAAEDLHDLAEAYIGQEHIQAEEDTERDIRSLANMRSSRAVGHLPKEETFPESSDLYTHARHVLECLFAPYNRAFHSNMTLEHAWFIGRAMNVLEAQQTKTHSASHVRMVVHKPGQQPEDARAAAPPAVTYEDSIAMLQQPAMQQRAATMISDTMRHYPHSASSLLDMIDASNAFLKAHHLVAEQQNEVPPR
jgi:hypothetical protein